MVEGLNGKGGWGLDAGGFSPTSTERFGSNENSYQKKLLKPDWLSRFGYRRTVHDCARKLGLICGFAEPVGFVVGTLNGFPREVSQGAPANWLQPMGACSKPQIA